jgi:hypothetical protein
MYGHPSISCGLPAALLQSSQKSTAPSASGGELLPSTALAIIRLIAIPGIINGNLNSTLADTVVGVLFANTSTRFQTDEEP